MSASGRTESLAVGGPSGRSDRHRTFVRQRLVRRLYIRHDETPGGGFPTGWVQNHQRRYRVTTAFHRSGGRQAHVELPSPSGRYRDNRTENLWRTLIVGVVQL